MSSLILSTPEYDVITEWLSRNMGWPIKLLDEIDLPTLKRRRLVNRLCTLDSDVLFNGHKSLRRVEAVEHILRDERFRRNKFSLCSRVPSILGQHAYVNYRGELVPPRIGWAQSDESYSFSYRIPYEVLLKEKGQYDPAVIGSLRLIYLISPSFLPAKLAAKSFILKVLMRSANSKLVRC